MSNNDIWTPEIWSRINGGPGPDKPGLLKETMGPIRVAQKVITPTVRGNDNPVPADTIDPDTGLPSPSLTKPMVTITRAFQLLEVHIKDPDLTMAMHQVRLAAQALALAEDALFFRGKSAVAALKESGIKVSPNADYLGDGLLGKAVEVNQPIAVTPSNSSRQDGFVYGSATFRAVTAGFSVFAAKTQGQPFSLILDPATFADANVPLQDSSIVTPASAIEKLLDGGQFTMSPSLPPNTGLLLSLGARTTDLYIGTGPVVSCDSVDGDTYHFTAKESLQFHTVDARSLIKLEFKTDAALADRTSK